MVMKQLVADIGAYDMVKTEVAYKESKAFL